MQILKNVQSVKFLIIFFAILVHIPGEEEGSTDLLKLISQPKYSANLKEI